MVNSEMQMEDGQEAQLVHGLLELGCFGLLDQVNLLRQRQVLQALLFVKLNTDILLFHY